MARWSLKESKEIPESFSITLNPLVAQVLFSRGLLTEEDIKKFISPDYGTDLNDPFLFRDMEKVVERIKKARDKKEKVAIFGDYDADGVTASIIMKEVLDDLGIDSFVYIPDKNIEGYGMNRAAVEMIKEKKASLIITVDCGITSVAEIEKANSLGIDVIITDHHHVPEILPPAFAIINPQAKNSGYPFKDLAGVGVAFKVVQAVYQKLLAEKIEQAKWLLDLVAIGTIADCVPLIGENRLFAKYGLKVLSKTKRIGLKELFKVGRIIIDENTLPDTRKVAFYIAPRINAAGRIKHANLAFDLVFEKSAAKARELALEIEEQNTQRQKITDKITEEVEVLARNAYKDKKFIFAIGEHFSIGVLGLVAGKIVQKFNKPAAVFQEREDVCTGSFRSIPQLNIIEAIEECKDLLVKFGGHSQAAGASVKKENVEKFYEKMNGVIEEKLKGADLSEEIEIDGEALPENITFELAEDLGKLEPFGEGNEEPVFLIKNLKVKEKRVVGNGNKHIKLFLEADGILFGAISFNGYEKFSHIAAGDNVDILCYIQKDEWNGNKKVQLKLIDLKISL
jgi:single-stranded-DNA-specific exonuclease